jgi:arylsulfatase A-like enzyme
MMNQVATLCAFMTKKPRSSSSRWLALAAVVVTFSPILAFSKTKKAAPAAVELPQEEMPVLKAIPVVEEKAPPAHGPNILFIIADDLNDWVGWLGGHPLARTPNMDRLAGMGIRFTNAHCSYALCNASRTSLMTGTNPWTNGVFGNEQDWRRSVQLIGKLTLPEFMQKSGYFSAAAGKVFHASHGGPEGRLTGWHGGRRGFELDEAWQERFPESGVQMPDLPVHTGQNLNGMNIWHWDWGVIDKNVDDMDDAKVAAWTAAALQQTRDRSAFLSIGFYHPHAPWYAPRKYFDMFPLETIQLPEVKEDDLDDIPEIAKAYLKGENFHKQILAKDLWKQAVQAYLACIAFTDDMLGRVLEAVEKSPQKDNTIIVFTSDHGWYLGQKQRWHKGGLWEEGTHIPLTIYAPGITHPGSVSSQPVSLVDLYPTITDLAGLKKPDHLDGESLLPLLKDPLAIRQRPAITATGGEEKAGYAIRSDRWRYIRYSDGSEELYDHQADPHEWTNLAKSADPAVIASLAAFLPKTWQSAHRPLRDVQSSGGADGSTSYSFIGGDSFDASASPNITGRGLDLELEFDYNPKFDRDSTLMGQGDAQLGWCLHIVDGKPAFTINYDGLHTTLKGDDDMPAGHVELRALMGLDGTLAMAITGAAKEIRGFAPMEDGFPREPAKGMSVGESFGPLPAKDFPNSSPFDGNIFRAVLHLLPATPPTS